MRAGRSPLIAAVLVVALLPGMAQAQQAAPPEAPAPAPADTGPRKEGATEDRRTIARFPANLVRATAGVFSPRTVRPALVGAAATGVSAVFDDEIAEALARPSNDFGQWLETGGSALVTGSIVALVFAGGRLTSKTRFRAVSYDWVDAFLVNAGYTSVLKVAVSRQRPNGEDERSFPSGHTSNAFALAAVAERHYGWKVGIPAYGLATAVGLSRLARNAHYLSDVAAGATLGYIVGQTVVLVNGGPVLRKRAQVDVSPVVGHGARALVVQVVF